VKELNVFEPLLTPTEEVYTEPEIDAKGRIKLDEKDPEGNNLYKHKYQITPKDTPIYRVITLGDVLTTVLDQKDEPQHPSMPSPRGKMSPNILVNRFHISRKVHKAITNKTTLEISKFEEKIITAALDKCGNGMFIYRLKEALGVLHVGEEDGE